MKGCVTTLIKKKRRANVNLYLVAKTSVGQLNQSILCKCTSSAISCLEVNAGNSNFIEQLLYSWSSPGFT